MVKIYSSVMALFMSLASVAYAADCTTSKDLTSAISSIPAGELPSKVVVNVPVSLASVFAVSTSTGDSPDKFSVKGSAKVSSSFSNLAPSISYATSTKTLTVNITSSSGSSGVRSALSASNLVTSVAACTYLATTQNENYKTNMFIGAAIYGLLSMNSVSAADSCTASGTVSVVLPAGWVAAVGTETNKAKGVFVYTLTKTTSSPTAPTTKTPTASPTTPTTKGPTDSPTAPTPKTPTKSPTTPTTKAPSKAPTAPTNAPSKAPTKPPSAAPTKSPTAPTNAPSKTPTKTPTTAPTSAPTAPTTTPTKVPTKSPTFAPTKAPTPPA